MLFALRRSLMAQWLLRQQSDLRIKAVFPLETALVVIAVGISSAIQILTIRVVEAVLDLTRNRILTVARYITVIAFDIILTLKGWGFLLE
jgi:hypothetical protein